MGDLITSVAIMIPVAYNYDHDEWPNFGSTQFCGL